MLYRTENLHGGDVYAREIELDYSANINPYGTPQSVIDAAARALTRIRNYPDPYCRALVRAIADYEQVPEPYVLCGSGAAELIYAYCSAARPRCAAELAPTFSEYALGLETVGCRTERYYLRKENGFALDEGFFDFLEKTAPEAVFLCNPNNPTGRLIPRELLARLLEYCRERGIRMLLDECFIDLSEQGESMVDVLGDFPGLLILKAFTKNYGMAGLRLGYCLSADDKLLARMSAATQPWNVSTPAQAAGVAAIGEREFVAKARRTVDTERTWLTERLRGCSFEVCPSSTNFILFRGPEDLHTALLEKKIAIRNCDNFHGLGPGWYRIAVRLREQNEKLMDAICETIGER